jgi:hypothetical protein
MILVSIAAVAGCRGGASVPRIEPGQAWTYRVIAPPLRYVETVRALRTVPVAGTNGVELVSSLGTSRIAWKGDVLYASQLGATRYRPALILWSPRAMDYKGESETLGKKARIVGSLTPVKEQVTVTINGEAVKTRECSTRFKADGEQREIRTWIHPQRGIVQQEERVDGRFRIQVQMLSETTDPIRIVSEAATEQNDVQ